MPYELPGHTKNSVGATVSEQPDLPKLAEMTTEIVSAYVSHNPTAVTDVPSLITVVAERLGQLTTTEEPMEPAKPTPAVTVRQSLGRDHITCMVCGKRQRALKRHLAVAHQLTPPEYREMFGLKPDYPMIAPSYAEARAEVARRIGLGRSTGARATRTPRRRRSS
jgi:predicted transcriptional regulator